MRVLLTETAMVRFGDRLAGTAFGEVVVEPIVMTADGTLRAVSVSAGWVDSVDSAEPVPWEEAAVEVAWPTADLFDEGAPLRPFFGFLLQATTLKWIQSPAAGVDAPVFATLVRRGIRLTTSHVTAIPISEYVLRAALDHYQQPGLWAASSADREWRRHDFREVHGTTWLVYGLGSIGAAVATRARAFGARVVGVRRSPSGDEPVDAMVPPADVVSSGALGSADVVVLTAPLTAATRGLVDDAFLTAMKPGSLLINIARGGLVDEEALVRALDAGTSLEAAILDVTSTEPLPADSALWSHPRVTITPHDSAGGLGRYSRAADLFLDNLRRYVDGDTLMHEVTEADLEPPAG